VIERQAIALARRSENSRVRAALENACSFKKSPAEWDSLSRNLSLLSAPEPHALRPRDTTITTPLLVRVNRLLLGTAAFLPIPVARRDPQIPEASAIRGRANGQVHEETRDSGAIEFLKMILERFWEGTPPTWTYAQTSPAARAEEKCAASWPIAPTTHRALTGDSGAADDDIPAKVRELTEMAEDLLSMQLLRHVSQFVAQLRVMVTFIVITSFSLLLALNSYPFPMQNRTEFLLTILIAVAAAAILRIIVGINRDETISRVANTASGFKLDRNLLAALIGYVLPLIGILAAVSYDFSDLLRVWLDPIFHHFM
jgi:hypothetical protein